MKEVSSPINPTNLSYQNETSHTRKFDKSQNNCYNEIAYNKENNPIDITAKYSNFDDDKVICNKPLVPLLQLAGNPGFKGFNLGNLENLQNKLPMYNFFVNKNK